MRIVIKIVTVLLTAVILLFAAEPAAGKCDYDDGTSEIAGQLEDILSDYDIDWTYGDISGLTFRELTETVKNSLSDRLKAPARLLGILLTVIVFTSMMKGISGGFIKDSGRMYDMVCVMTAAAAVTPALFTVYQSSLTSIEQTSRFILVFVPVFAGITIASGGAVTGGAYNLLILGASEGFAAAAGSFFMPVLTMNAALAVSGSVFPNSPSDSITALMKKAVTWGLTVFMTLFTGFVTLRSTLSAKADGAAAKTVKFMISGTVPIVGGAVSDAYATVCSSFDLIRSTVGTAGCFAIEVIMLPPMIELMIFRLVMWICTAAAELLSADSLVRLMKGIDSGLAIAMSVLVSYGVMLIVSTGIVVQSLG